MRLYLMRHGEAEEPAVDPERPLTERGREQVRRVTEIVAGMEGGLRTLRHSGKLRARQTADIVARRLEPARGPEESAGLAPEDDPADLLAGLPPEDSPALLVGHLPFLARLASLLLLGDPGRPLVELPCAGTLCLERRGVWRLRWLVTPELLGPSR